MIFRYIYRNELDNVCFQHEIAYEDFKDLPRRTTSDKVLRHSKLLAIQGLMVIYAELHQ